MQGMEHTDTAILILAGIAAFMAGLSKGGLSLLGAMSVPLLALVMSPVKAAALLLPIFVVSDVFGLWSYRREYDKRNLTIILPAAIVGIAIGWATASMISERGVGLLVGVIGLTFCINSWRVRHRAVVPRPADIPRGVLWGTITGFVSFVSHSGGPSYQVYVLPQRLPKTIYAGTTTIAFAVMNAVKLIPYWALGQFSTDNLRASALLIPVAIAGTLTGVRLVRIMPERGFYLFTQTMLFVVSARLVMEAFTH